MSCTIAESCQLTSPNRVRMRAKIGLCESMCSIVSLIDTVDPSCVGPAYQVALPILTD